MKINKMELSNKAIRIRDLLKEDPMSPVDIFRLINKIEKLSLILYPLGKNISGMCIRMKESSIIVVNTDCSKGRQNYTLAHELYHYYFSDENSSSICYFDQSGKQDEERKADIFASYFLLPSPALDEMLCKKERIDLKMIIQIEQSYGISHKALLTRMVMDEYIGENEIKEYENDVIRNASYMGFDIRLYEITKEEGTFGYYIEKVDELYRTKRISEDKREELYRECMREDLLNDDAEEGRYIVD